MGISRAVHSPTTLHRISKVNRRPHLNVSQARNLWWWGKRRHGWFSQDQPDTFEIEERLRRHQALMMHRWTKAMRRRSLWDRDDSPCSSAWKMRGHRLWREMSSTEPARAKVEEREREDSSRKEPWQEFHKDFESFKRAVDRAIERDPYGTLFGRRLRSPETANNSSWTSWSWIFDPKEIKEEPKAKTDTEKIKQKSVEPKETKTVPTDGISIPISTSVQPSDHATTSSSPTQPQPSVVHTSSSSKTATSLKSSHSVVFHDHASVTTEYVYDPISGRKVPQISTTDVPPVNDTNSTQSSSSSPPSPSLHQTRDPPPKPAGLPKSAAHKSLFQTIFGENGVDIPVKTYKPPKVYGYTGEAKSSPKANATLKTAKDSLEHSRKREYDLLRLRTLGNNIDATNFNCEPWNNKEAESPNVEQTELPPEKKVRTSPAPNEEEPLFAGTTYASRTDVVASGAKQDWLAKEGFRARQGMTMPSLKESNARPPSSEPLEKIQPALDRAKARATEIPVKRFGSKLQPAMDRIVPPPKIEPAADKTENMQTFKAIPDTFTAEEKKQDIDLLRASDVRAAAKAARVTKQEFEDKKKQDRRDLEKDFKARQPIQQIPDSMGARVASTSASNGAMDNFWQHIKKYPTGIVARTMQSIGMTNDTHDKESRPAKAQNLSSVSTATVVPTDTEGKHFEKLASDLNDIYKEAVPQESIELERPGPTHTTASTTKPIFSEPTVKPGVIRDLTIERHTKEFEPKIASIVDKAKNVKRELYGVSQEIGDVVNHRAIAAIADRDSIMKEDSPALEIPKGATSPKQETVSAAKTLEARPIEEAAIKFDSPFMLLTHNKTTGDVEAMPLQNLMGQTPITDAKMNAMTAIASLNNPSAFVKHFASLDKNGYELTSGGGDMLVFQKQAPTPTAVGPSTDTFTELTPPHASTSSLRSTIAAAEVAAQPPTRSPKEAANVLDEIPPSIPVPGPAAPTAPPSSQGRASRPSESIPTPAPSTSTSVPAASETAPASSSRRTRSRGVNRQEQIFSGQVRLAPQKTGLPDHQHFQKQNPIDPTTASSYQYQQQESTKSQLSFFARLRRTVRRTVLTIVAVATGAYGIGVIAEVINAKAQIEGSGGVGGPMKRIVMEDQTKKERQRAGIFSTESSR